MARRFGSAMTSNTDSTLFIYLTENIRVKGYLTKAPGRFQPAHREVQSGLLELGGLEETAKRRIFFGGKGLVSAAHVGAPLKLLRGQKVKGPELGTRGLHSEGGGGRGLTAWMLSVEFRLAI